jgi:hypothetical protein
VSAQTRLSHLIEALQKLQSIHGDVLVTVTDPYDGKRYPAALEVEVDEFDRFESIHVRPGVWPGSDSSSSD